MLYCNKKSMKKIILFLFFIKSFVSFSQKETNNFYFNNLLEIQKEFNEKEIKWPPKKIFIRVFKHEKNLEIWVTDSIKYRFFKNYKICKLSGGIGPKRKEGDLQVPEGFYYINDFNNNSKYHLSLGITYPNKSDRILTPYKDIGGSIYIHGDCVSVGCVAVGDSNIEEIFTLSKFVHSNGQDSINVHIFPINFYDLKSLFFLEYNIELKNDLIEFEKNILEGFLFFEENEILPKILIDENGKYYFY